MRMDFALSSWSLAAMFIVAFLQVLVLILHLYRSSSITVAMFELPLGTKRFHLQSVTKPNASCRSLLHVRCCLFSQPVSRGSREKTACAI